MRNCAFSVVDVVMEWNSMFTCIDVFNVSHITGFVQKMTTLKIVNQSLLNVKDKINIYL